MIFVVAEQRGGTLHRGSWEVVAAAQQMGAPVTVIVVGEDGASVAAELAAADVAEVVALEHAALRGYTADGFVAALASIVSAEAPSHVLFPHTYQTRDFAPRLAARAGGSLVTDVVRIRPHDASFVYTRPIFQGKLHADIVLDQPAPHFVTIQAGAFRAEDVRRSGAKAAVRRVEADIDPGAIRQRPEPPFQQVKAAVDLSHADRIVAVGRGIKDQEHLAAAESLARALGAELAASRPICDAGWLPMDRQVGSSGQTVAPGLYVALGISGAIQHVVGMKGAKTIVAINKDPDAPIFEVADYGIVGDLFEIVPAIVKALEVAPKAD